MLWLPIMGLRSKWLNGVSTHYKCELFTHKLILLLSIEIFKDLWSVQRGTVHRHSLLIVPATVSLQGQYWLARFPSFHRISFSKANFHAWLFCSFFLLLHHFALSLVLCHVRAPQALLHHELLYDLLQYNEDHTIKIHHLHSLGNWWKVKSWIVLGTTGTGTEIFRSLCFKYKS